MSFVVVMPRSTPSPKVAVTVDSAEAARVAEQVLSLRAQARANEAQRAMHAEYERRRLHNESTLPKLVHSLLSSRFPGSALVRWAHQDTSAESLMAAVERQRERESQPGEHNLDKRFYRALDAYTGRRAEYVLNLASEALASGNPQVRLEKSDWDTLRKALRG